MKLPEPPAYFARSMEGIPAPSLHKFMEGYLNLFKVNIPSKTQNKQFQHY